MTHEKRRYSAEDYVLMAAFIDPTSGNKAREIHEMLTHAASMEAQIVEALDERDTYKAVLDKFMIQWESDIQFYNGLDGHDLGTWADLFREALSKFRGTS